MALQGPVGKENLEISFRLQTKSQFFDGSNNALSGAQTDIVTSASCHGLVFIGSSNPELIVACLKDLESSNAVEKNVPIRKHSLPSATTQISANCDGSLLAVVVKINGTPLVQIFSVASFLTPNVQKVREFRLSTDNSNAIQLCWNPVMNSTLALVTDSGALNTYTLKDASNEFHSTDPNYKAKCCCWSPKGKQIVVGFGNGKLAQFTPELKPAKIIECPQGIVSGNFDTIAIQWLSTFQFAVAFLSHQPESRPVLHIVNAPKAGPPQYIAYNDVCYSSNETRPSKIYIRHIMQWNLLLVASSNAIDVSFLRVSQAGDLPVWTQEFPNDLYPAELPLTPSKDESFPLGFEVDTGCSNRLLQEDGNPFPVMPMIHILSTAGALSSFYILNTTSSYTDICSPPRPIDASVMGLFKAEAPELLKTPPKAEIPFAPQVQSTPAQVPKVSQPVKPQLPFAGISLPTASQVTPAFTSNPAFQAPPKTTAPATVPAVTQVKPQALITVPQNYTPSQAKSETAVKPVSVEKVNNAEDEQVYSRMIQDEIKAFELELRAVMEKSRSLKVKIGTKEESAEMRRNIEELDELKKEATETIESLRSDVQSNRLGLTEMFSMVFEARAKVEQAKNDKSIFMHGNQVQDRSSKRTFDRLIKQVAHCEMQLQMAVQVMNGQWANYQEAINKSKRNRMHNPSLEGLYQTLTKQQEIIYRQGEKMAVLKSRLGLREGNMKLQINNTTIESFSDSMISISLADQVQSENSKLTNKKLKNLRNILAGRDIITIKPQRPERSGLSSEIIKEKKMQAMKTMKRPAGGSVASSAPQAFSQTANSAPMFSAASKQALTTPQTQPVFAQQKVSIFGTNATPQAPKVSLSNQKKPEDTPKPSFGGFQPSQGSTTFVLNLSSSNNAPVFGVPSSNTSTFGMPATTIASPFSVASTNQPSFSLSSSPLVIGGEKRKEDATQRLYINPVAHKTAENATKTPSTIGDTKIAVSATFSIPLANKVSPSGQKEQPRVVEKKLEESKTENTSFTFKLADKKDEPSKAPSATPNLTALLSGAGDTSKGFSFGTPNTASPFGSLSSFTTKTEAPAVTTTTASVFSSFGSSPATTTSSIFGTGFGSGFSLSLSGDGDKTASSAFPLNLTSSTEASKTTSTSSTAAGSLSFASLTPWTTSSDTKTVSETTSQISVKPTPVSTNFSFSNALASTKPTEAVAPTTFSFASLGSTINSSTAATVSSTTATISPTISASSAAQTELSKTLSNVTSSTSTESTLQSLDICSPEVKQPLMTSPPASVLGSAVKSEASSIFGSSAFGSALASTQSSVFGAQSPSVAVTSNLTSPVATTTSPSIFSTQANATTPSLFGSLSLSGDANKPSTPSSPPTGLFSSLVKPDQSVFPQSSTSPAAATSPFGAVFGGAAGNQSPSVFGAPAATSPSTNVFGGPASIFSSAAAQPTAFGQQQSSVFGQNAAPATGGSLFSQSTFATPATTAPTSSIFGAPQASSPFGGSSVFGSGQAQSPSTAQSGSIFGGQSTFGSNTSQGSIFGGGAAVNAPSPFGSASVFGGNALFSNSSFGGVGQSGFAAAAAAQPSFGQAPSFGASPTFGGQATFGSPKSNIFGQQAATGQSNSLFEQLGSQQSGGNLFGNLAQSPQQQQQQQQPPPPQGGFQGSAFSSWR